MSQLKISEHLFLGRAEIDRLVRFLSDDGFKQFMKLNTHSFGVLKNDVDASTSFLVQQGSGVGTIQIFADSYALDKEMNLIHQKPIDDRAVTDDGNWYYVRISYTYSNIEEGTIDIDSSGNMSGTDTKFTEVLRGQPDFPAKIRLYDPVNQIGYAEEYEILEVADDTNAVVQGDFSSINVRSFQYTVVGTFTPGVVIPAGNKDIFQYDSCFLSLVQGNPPVLQPDGTYSFSFPAPPEEDMYFYIAAVQRVGSVITVLDTRDYYTYKSYIEKESELFAKIQPNNLFEDFYSFKYGAQADWDAVQGKLTLDGDGSVYICAMDSNSVIKEIVRQYTDFPQHSLIYIKFTGTNVKFATTGDGGKFTNLPDEFEDETIGNKWYILYKTVNAGEWEILSFSNGLFSWTNAVENRVQNLETAWVAYTEQQILDSVSLDSGFTEKFTLVESGGISYKFANRNFVLNINLDIRKESSAAPRNIFVKLPDNVKVSSDKDFSGRAFLRGIWENPSNSMSVDCIIEAIRDASYLKFTPILSYNGAPTASTIVHGQQVTEFLISQNENFPFYIQGSIEFEAISIDIT